MTRGMRRLASHRPNDFASSNGKGVRDMTRTVLNGVTAIGAVIVATLCVAAKGTDPAPAPGVLSMRIPNEAAPPGAMVQMKVMTTEVTPISGGRPGFGFDMAFFRRRRRVRRRRAERRGSGRGDRRRRARAGDLPQHVALHGRLSGDDGRAADSCR